MYAAWLHSIFSATYAITARRDCAIWAKFGQPRDPLRAFGSPLFSYSIDQLID
jgi:hypothetical protein